MTFGPLPHERNDRDPDRTPEEGKAHQWPEPPPLEPYAWTPVSEGEADTGVPQPGQPASVWKAVLGPLIFVGLLVLKFGKVAFIAIKSVKFFTTSATMLVSVAAYTVIWGLPFAAGFVLLILVHELGHSWQAKREGLDVSAPVFIPFLGAAILLKQQPQNALVEARIAIAGPIVGSLGALAVYGASIALDSIFLQALAFTGFFLNLFNLIPLSPLDGGRVTAALSPKLWAIGVVVMVGMVLVNPNPFLILIVLLGLWETWQRWKGRGHAAHYYESVTPTQRAAVAVSYVGLISVLSALMQLTHVPRSL